VAINAYTYEAPGCGGAPGTKTGNLDLQNEKARDLTLYEIRYIGLAEKDGYHEKKS